ncbi:hypothetical protein Acr_07g0011640 [Actinidia rufa]|uniref:Uncharacterized protein n=1 Tax=Actinidia rufa TaxID=165716 RepID=A0A7J0EX41_9ERIC|nr:hypothetical protein Acr_07g0011640 [Actinidia rufa]
MATRKCELMAEKGKWVRIEKRLESKGYSSAIRFQQHIKIQLSSWRIVVPPVEKAEEYTITAEVVSTWEDD